ncbi:MAG: 6-bladed beta-propeller [Candidatus Krumholzibacteria bacterium]|nr:6-bladed beta-propeller [Candidatus Krumholzibacteria bacterium]
MTIVHAFRSKATALACTPLLVLATAAAAGDGEAKVTSRDGVRHVLNPAIPAEPAETFDPRALWQAGGEDDEAVFFGLIVSIDADPSGHTYLLDGQLSEVFVFDGEGNYLRSIGREGEGPGEFRRAGDLFVTPEGNVAIMQRMPGKIVVLTPEGDPLGDYPTPRTPEGSPLFFESGGPAGDGVILATRTFARKETGMEITEALVRVDRSGEIQTTYREQASSRDFANMVFDEKSSMPPAWAAGSDGTLYLSDDFDAYAIQVYGPDGTLAHVIERAYEHRKRSPEEMERFKPRVSIRRNDRSLQPESKASPTDRDVVQMFARPDGTVWVLSSRGAFAASAGVIATFDVFDREGRFVRQVSLRGEGSYRDDGIHLVGDRLYLVRGLRAARVAMFGLESGAEPDAEAEAMSVACYDLGRIVQGQR